MQWTKLDDEKKIISSSDYSHVCDDISSNGYIFFFRHTSPALNESPNSAEPFTQRPAIEELLSIGISQSIAASVLASAAGNQQHAMNSINGPVVQQTEIVSLPRHFSFSYSHSIFADFQNRARLSVQNQNEEVLRAVTNGTKLFEELKIHLTRGYDTSTKNIYSAYPGCYPEACPSGAATTRYGPRQRALSLCAPRSSTLTSTASPGCSESISAASGP